MAEKKLAAKAANIETSAPTEIPVASETDVAPPRRIGRGILAAAIAASLVGGVALGGAGGFALAAALDRGPVGQGQGFGGQPPQGGMPGQPPSGQQGQVQGGQQGQGQVQGGEQDTDTDTGSGSGSTETEAE